MTARMVMPSRLLCDPDKESRLVYVPAIETNLKAKWQQFFDYHARPMNADRYQEEAITEHNSMRLPNER